ncbi:MAG: class I SAM-dependent methyltransferase [Fidelibacterota bacterium]
MSYKIWKNLEQVEAYANKRYKSWDQRWLSNRELRLVEDLIKDHQLAGPILDCPSGFGRFHDPLSRVGKVYGADLNRYAVEYYNKYISADPPAIEARAENLPFPDNHFSGVFSFRLLQHIHTPEDRIAILKEFARVSSSWVIASFYVSSPLHTLHRLLVKMPSRITMISSAQLRIEAEASGLTMMDLRSVLPGLHANRIVLFSVTQ